MDTHGEIVNQIVGLLRLNDVDSHISRRLILHTAKSKAKNYQAQKILDRTLSKEAGIYSEIKCFEFEKIDIISCPLIEFRSCSTLMRSKKPLPDMVVSRHGFALRQITSIDGKFDLQLVDAKDYRRNKQRKYQLNTTVNIYVDADNYAYIPDHEIYAVNLQLLTMDTELLEDCECNGKKDSCKSGWEYEFKVPVKLRELVVQDTVQTLLATYKQIMPDENPNGNEYARQ